MERIIKKGLTTLLLLSVAITNGQEVANVDTSTAKTVDALKIKRTYGKDLRGYTQNEIDLAVNILTGTLYPQREELKAKIKSLELAKADATDKGFLRNAPKTGLEEKYNDAVRDLKKAKADLERVNQEIYDQEIIAGIRRSMLVKGAIGAAITGVLLGSAIAADYFLNNGNMMRELQYKYSRLNFDIFNEGGLKNFLYNRVYGEPYKIKGPSQLKFWNKKLGAWWPVQGNEELAKKSFIVSSDDYDVPAGYDERHKTMLPTRGVHYFWDPIINAFRKTTKAEQRGSIVQEHEKVWLAE